MTQRNGILLGLFSILIVAVVCLIVYVSSLPSTDDKTQAIDRNGSVETAVSVEHADSTHDVINTSHKVWLHDSVYATLHYRDTIPALDSVTTEGEDNTGNTKSLRVKKDYQIFITVK
jgi:hypothetical protein